MAGVTENDVRRALTNVRDKRNAALAQDMKVVKAATNVLNATLKIAAAGNDPAKLALAVGDKAVKTTQLAAAAAYSKGLEASAFVGTQLLKSVGLIKVATMASPSRAATFITITMAEKIVSAAGLAADDKTLDKCHVAIASLVTTSAAGGFVCFGTLGIGCTAGVLAIAAEAFNVYGQCHGRP